MPNGPSGTRRIEDIERLRAIAALAVLIGHVPWLQVGISQMLGMHVDPWTGVDLFFVISGFVVSSAFERDLNRLPIGALTVRALGAFYRKRAARILPTAYIGLAMWWVGAAWWNISGAWGVVPHGRDAIAMVTSGVLLVSNYAEAWAGVVMPLYWFWSICVEEHFYLLYPTFRLMVPRSEWRAAFVMLIIATVLCARLVWGAVDVGGLSHLRFDQLSLGVLIGLARQRWPEIASVVASRVRASGLARGLAILTMLLLLIALGTLPTTWLIPSSRWATAAYPLAGILSALIVALASLDAGLLSVGQSRIGDGLVRLGARSYGIYMFHVPALWIVVEARGRLFANPQAVSLRVPELLAYVGVLALLVDVNYRFVERPLIAWAAKRQC